jgi:hypothetical protein
MKIRLIAVLAVAALSLMALAVPASAHGSDAAVFTGTAELTPALKIPGMTTVTGTWKFTAPATWERLAPVPGVCASVGHLSDCAIAVQGELGPVAGVVGASCGVSNGYNGSGSYGPADGNHSNNVEGVGWVASAGGTIPITSGTVNGTPIVGVVQAQGGPGCLGAGATTFNVVGVIAAD